MQAMGPAAEPEMAFDQGTSLPMRGGGCRTCNLPQEGYKGMLFPNAPWRCCLARHGMGCWAHHDEFGCDSFCSEARFIFGSCRAYFGFNCSPGPPYIPTPPGYSLPPGHWR
jgi:hypothetical protein